jgi:hypothetical protein
VSKSDYGVVFSYVFPYPSKIASLPMHLSKFPTCNLPRGHFSLLSVRLYDLTYAAATSNRTVVSLFYSTFPTMQPPTERDKVPYAAWPSSPTMPTHTRGLMVRPYRTGKEMHNADKTIVQDHDDGKLLWKTTHNPN